MSQENRDLTLQAVAAFNRRNLDAFLALAPRTPSTSRLQARHIADTMDCRWWEDLVGRGEDFIAEVQGARFRGRGADHRAP